MDAFEALALAGFSDELSGPSGTQRLHCNTVHHSVLPLTVGLLTRVPRLYDYTTDIDVCVIATFFDGCADFSDNDGAKLSAFIARYKATTWFNLGSEWECLCWNDQTGYSGFLEFIEDFATDSLKTQLPDMPGICRFERTP